jgi:hypothetical protein
LVFGENDHDRRAIKALIEGLRPDLAGRVHARRQPLCLIKNRPAEDALSEAEKIAAVVHAEKPVCAVFAHEDCDEVEPAHEALAKRKAAALASAIDDPGCSITAVTPAWEIEAWWFLWPQAVREANPSWREPTDYVGRNVGAITNAKEELRRCVRPRGKKPKPVRDYEEADSPDIAKLAVTLRLLDSHRSVGTTSASFEAFRDGALAVPRRSDGAGRR